MLMAVTAPTTATAPPMPIASAATTAAENAGSPPTRRTATADIAPHGVEPRQPGQRAVRLAHLIDAAEVALRRQARFMPGQAAGLVGRGQGFEVGADLLVEARVAAPRREDAGDAREPDTRSHRGLLLLQQPADHGDGAGPGVLLGAQLLPPGRGDGVEAGRRLFSLVPQLLLTQPFCSSRSSAG